MKIFTFVDNALLKGYALDSVVPDDKAYLAWKGGKIPLGLWSEIVAFLRAGYKHCNGECMGRLFYNEDTSEWRFEVFPQVSKGMHVDDSTDSDEGRELMALQLGAGYEAFGTVHHHCKSSAFQSGTDKDDELTAPGLHVTVGHIDSEELSLDMRFCFRGVMYAVNPLEWFESPVPGEAATSVRHETEAPRWLADMWASLEAQFRKDALTRVLKTPALWAEAPAIARAWLDRIKVPAKSGKKPGSQGLVVRNQPQNKVSSNVEFDEFDERNSYGWPANDWLPVESIPEPDDRFAGAVGAEPADAANALDEFDDQLARIWPVFAEVCDVMYDQASPPVVFAALVLLCEGRLVADVRDVLTNVLDDGQRDTFEAVLDLPSERQA